MTGKVVFVPKIVSSYRTWSGSLTDKRIATKHWMKEIDIWTNKIIKLANIKLKKEDNTFNWDRYKDEIYARNLLAGMNNIYKSKNFKDVYTYHKSCRYPKYALLKTKIRIWKTIILSKARNMYAR